MSYPKNLHINKKLLSSFPNAAIFSLLSKSSYTSQQITTHIPLKMPITKLPEHTWSSVRLSDSEQY